MKKIKWKRTSCLVLAGILAASLYGCGNSGKDQSAPESTTASGAMSDAAANSSSGEALSEPAAETTAVQAAAPVYETVELNVAYHPGLAALCVPGIGEKHGFFEEEGLKINWIQFTAGPPEIAAMVAGDLQFGYIGHGAHTLCAQGEAQVVSLSHVSNSEWLIVRENSGIKSMEDLKGKKIVTQLGTSGEVILNLALERAGMTRSDVNVYNMDMAGAVSAFIAGQADAICSWDAHNHAIRTNVEEELYTLAQTSDFMDKMAFPGSWVATSGYLADNHDIAVRFVRALNKCYEYRAGNMDETIQLSAEFGGLEYEAVDANRDSAIYYSATELKQMLADGEITDIYQSQLNNFIETGKVEDGDVAEYVRTDIMAEALEYLN